MSSAVMSAVALFLVFCLAGKAVEATPRRFSPLSDETSSVCRQNCKGTDCLIAPEGCVSGTYVDQCGYLNCKKRPGSRCMDNDECASDEKCVCGKCTGCYMDRQGVDSSDCFQHENLMDCLIGNWIHTRRPTFRGVPARF